jgi:integrase
LRSGSLRGPASQHYSLFNSLRRGISGVLTGIDQLRACFEGDERALEPDEHIGTEVDAQNIVNRHFKPLLKRAELPDIRWHDLRHTCATLLLSRGTHPKYVQQLFGHASIRLTLDRYSHWIPSIGRHAAEGIDEVLS